MRLRSDEENPLSTDRPFAVRIGLLLAAGILAACAGEDAEAPSGDLLQSPRVADALSAVEADAIERHIRVLAHDSLAGRAPGTPGFEGASRYVEAHFDELGLQRAGEGESYRQPVSLRESVVDEAASELSLTRNGETRTFAYADDFILSGDPNRADVTVTAPVVFAGYGVSAPDLGYDDYADVDVDGKIVVYLSGAPPAFPSTQRAYYSSGAVKEAEAASRGAVGMLSFTSPDDPRFRWQVSVARSRRGSYAWLDAQGQPGGGGEATEVRASGTLNHPVAEALFEGAPTPLGDVFDAAAASTPQGFDLSGDVTVHVVSRHRTVESHNLVARLEGSDPELRDEHVVFIGHLDHFGVGDPVDGDEIYNGAHDNASGTSIVMEIARAFAGLDQAPRRSVLFLVVTAEEWGLLGTDYFVHHPTVPGEGLVAAMTLDMPFLFHPLLDIVPYGAEHSTLSEAVTAAAERMGLAIGPDPIPEQVLFIRSDHYAFVRQGVPALFIKSGFETGDDRDGGAINTAFRQDRYHTPQDESDQGFDFEAGADHARVNFLTGYWVAMQDAAPSWNPGDFFEETFGRSAGR